MWELRYCNVADFLLKVSSVLKINPDGNSQEAYISSYNRAHHLILLAHIFHQRFWVYSFLCPHTEGSHPPSHFTYYSATLPLPLRIPMYVNGLSCLKPDHVLPSSQHRATLSTIS